VTSRSETSALPCVYASTVRYGPSSGPRRDSNPQPAACKADALPIELRAHPHRPAFVDFVCGPVIVLRANDRPSIWFSKVGIPVFLDRPNAPGRTRTRILRLRQPGSKPGPIQGPIFSCDGLKQTKTPGPLGPGVVHIHLDVLNPEAPLHCRHPTVRQSAAHTPAARQRPALSPRTMLCRHVFQR
jgi:hypothetical protein